ncbi:MFS transporter [Kitasatospora sp. NPDC006697]|uniref:MFS transporter n=1 Tax=Kitasatospora sp. NPDC006697 TaxID=3364020 RepID=UPI0036CFA9EF
MDRETGDGSTADDGARTGVLTSTPIDPGETGLPGEQARQNGYLSARHVAQFVGGRAVAALGDQFLLFAIPLLAYKITGSASKSGLIFFVEWLPRILFMPIAGVLADRIRGYFLFVGSDGVRAALALAAFGLMYAVPGGQFAVLCVLVAGMALANAQSYIALESSLPRFVPMEQMVRAQSVVQGTEQTSEVLGPVLAALLSAVLPTRDMLLVIGAVYALTTLNIFVLRPHLRAEVVAGEGEPTTLRSIGAGVLDGARTLRSLPAIIGLAGLTMTVNLMVGVGMSTSAAITSGTFHKSDRYFGVLTTAAGVVGILTSFVVPKLAKRLNPMAALAISYGMICLGGIGISQSANFPEFAVSYSLLIGSIGFFNVFIRMERVKRIPREHFAKTIAIIILLNQISLPVAGLLVTVFATAHDPRTVSLGSAVGSVCIAVLLIPLLIQLRYHHAHPGSAPDHR